MTPIADVRVTVDVVLFAIFGGRLHVLIVRRGVAPYRGRWALPGGFVRRGEPLEATARRELAEETGVRDVYLEQLFTFGDPSRDPRGRVVTVAYFALVAGEGMALRASTDAADVRWHELARPVALAFDHGRIVAAAIRRLRGKLDYSDVGFELLPAEFTLTELQRVHEAVLGRRLDKRNFRRRIALLGTVAPVGRSRARGLPRPAALYRFSRPRRSP